jgi:hypothetical protein
MRAITLTAAHGLLLLATPSNAPEQTDMYSLIYAIAAVAWLGAAAAANAYGMPGATLASLVAAFAFGFLAFHKLANYRSA